MNSYDRSKGDSREPRRRPVVKLPEVRPPAVADRSRASPTGLDGGLLARRGTTSAPPPPRVRDGNRAGRLRVGADRHQDGFERWMAAHEYRDAYFASPRLIQPELRRILRAARRPSPSEHHRCDSTNARSSAWSAPAVSSASASTSGVRPDRARPGRDGGTTPGFFPGEVEGNNYRLLGAQDGWNYLATLITAEKGWSCDPHESRRLRHRSYRWRHPEPRRGQGQEPRGRRGLGDARVGAAQLCLRGRVRARPGADPRPVPEPPQPDRTAGGLGERLLRQRKVAPMRVLEYLWRDYQLPSGASARALATLPPRSRLTS